MPVSPQSYTRIVYAQPTKGLIDVKTFRAEEVPFDLKPGADEVVVRIDYLSLDPAMRLWINDGDNEFNYTAPVQVGQTMRGIGLATVIEAGENSGFSVGDHVSGTVGVTEYNTVKASTLTKIDLSERSQLLDFIGPLGHPGITAYIGLFDIGQIKAGETLVVSGAAGAVGSLVCQLGKDKGAKVYGTVGSAEKCKYLEEDVGVVKALNYKSPTFREDFVREFGKIDVFFDNVGGEILDFALTRLNMHARVVLCGSISSYTSEAVPFKNFSHVFFHRARVEGFSLIDQGHRFADARAYLAEKVAQGALKSKYHILEGIEEVPMAINMLFRGENNGKLVVKIAHD
ncbi:uncharacterized protein B0H18DRAFT_998608 [Fomitopsis serialis]|uniref:uncharacterized protein n=1 Tax=Fomitopsis serialis TaxID=139415 RepID=UPI0020077AAA|nr:uncharacterized protein B0H18DRAFT_998608 [Neoantrodia serialis]KAH9929261.1 hypothetical protein B0H18DRAFT_998608 [Neoantrodia serialis]